MRLRGIEAWQLSVMRAQGREAEAQRFLDAINCIQTGFGFEAYDMPEPAIVGSLTERADLEPKPVGKGRWQVAA